MQTAQAENELSPAGRIVTFCQHNSRGCLARYMQLRLVTAACAQHRLLARTPIWTLRLPDMQA